MHAGPVASTSAIVAAGGSQVLAGSADTVVLAAADATGVATALQDLLRKV